MACGGGKRAESHALAGTTLQDMLQHALCKPALTCTCDRSPLCQRSSSVLSTRCTAIFLVPTSNQWHVEPESSMVRMPARISDRAATRPALDLNLACTQVV
jgi:hypothetical protein